MDSFGEISSEDAVQLVVDISKSPNRTCTANNQTYNKYSLFYTIPTYLPVENEAYQVKKKKKKLFRTMMGKNVF